jgi:hypothetical protein
MKLKIDYESCIKLEIHDKERWIKIEIGEERCAANWYKIRNW